MKFFIPITIAHIIEVDGASHLQKLSTGNIASLLERGRHNENQRRRTNGDETYARTGPTPPAGF
jgi:hypothetical protein